MSEKKLFSDKRWHDIPKAETVGHIVFTDEEKKKNEELTKKMLRDIGVEIQKLDINIIAPYLRIRCYFYAQNLKILMLRA